MDSLAKRLKPLLTGAVSLDQLDNHTRQCLDLYTHFRASALIDSGNPDVIRFEIDKMPEVVRELVREKARELYKRRRL